MGSSKTANIMIIYNSKWTILIQWIRVMVVIGDTLYYYIQR